MTFTGRISKDNYKTIIIDVIKQDESSENVSITFSSRGKFFAYQLNLLTGEYVSTAGYNQEYNKIMEDIRYFGNNSIHFINSL